MNLSVTFRLKLKKSVYISDANSETEYQELIVKENLKALSIMSVPILGRDEDNVIEVLTLGHHKSFAFDKQTQKSTEDISNQIGIALRFYRETKFLNAMQEIDEVILAG